MIWLNAKADDNILYIPFSLFSYELFFCYLSTGIIISRTTNVNNFIILSWPFAGN
jgi:hypothetical protein